MAPIKRFASPMPTGLRRRLLFLVLGSVLPFLILIGFVARRHLLDQKPLAAERAMVQAQRQADLLDDHLSSIASVMKTAALSLSALPVDRPDNDRVLQGLVATFGPGLASWRAFAEDGREIGSSGSVEFSALPDSIRLLSQVAAGPTATLVTEPTTTPAGAHVVHMILPMRDVAGRPAVLVAQIGLATLGPMLSTAGLPRGSSVAVISGEGSVLGRVPHEDAFIGRSVSNAPSFRLSQGRTAGISQATTPDGVDRLLAFTRMRTAPWLVWTGVPMSAVFAQARVDFARAVGWGALALALALVLATWQASRIIDPVTRLSADAAKLGSGNLAHRSGVFRKDELGVLAATINEMATTLEQQGAVLRESEERYRGLFDINPIPMWVLDPETLGFLAVNRAAVDAYGFTEEEFLAMKASAIRREEDVPELLRHMRESTGKTNRYLTRHRRKDGSVFQVEIDAGAITFDGRPARLVVAHDVSERVRAEEALRDAETQLRQSQRLEAIGQLTGGIAHDFNNVLTAIGSYSDFLYESLEPGDARRLDILEIRKASDRAAALTKQLLAFSRSQILQPKVVSVNDSLAELQLLLRRLLTADIELKLALDPDAGHVRVDPGQFAQVVMNLAVNARDAMAEGGTLTIASRNEIVTDTDAGGPLAAKPGRYVVIEVSDTGAGIDEDTIQRIFEPYFTTKGPGKGTGLGLATVHGIVHQSGGYITAASEIGKGATFTIRLPQVEQQVEPEQPKAERAPGGGRTETILVVEDEEAVRRAAKRMLVKRGYTVIEAGDGNEALEIIQSHVRIDLLLTDLVMPGMGGRELVRVLREQGRPVATLYMSGYTKDAVMRSELDPGIMVLEKPFSQEELATKVREVLDRSGGNGLGAAS